MEITPRFVFVLDDWRNFGFSTTEECVHPRMSAMAMSTQLTISMAASASDNCCMMYLFQHQKFNQVWQDV
jgi:hypothetical protein